MPDRVTHSHRPLRDREGCTRCFLAASSQDYLLDRFRPCSPRGLPTLLPTLGPWVHTTPRLFQPRCYAYSRTRPIHPVQPPPLSCDGQMQPSYCFQGCHPYSPDSPRPLRSCPAIHQTGGAASGLVRGRFPSTQGSPPCHSGWRYLRPHPIVLPASHLSERVLARADYSCRHGSPVDSTARGVTPDFVRPPFGSTGLTPGRFVDTPCDAPIRIERTTSSTVSDLPASAVPHLTFWVRCWVATRSASFRGACG